MQIERSLQIGIIWRNFDGQVVWLFLPSDRTTCVCSRLHDYAGAGLCGASAARSDLP